MRLVWQLIRSPEVPLYLKILPALAFIYILIPTDFIPDFIPGLGQLDDLTALIVGAKVFIELAPQDVVARHASFSAAAPQPVQMYVNQHDVMYYEPFDDEPEYMHPGIIVRAPLSPHQISSPEALVISNGHTLSLSEAKETTDFNLVAPLRLHPGFQLDQIRRIDGRDALQLLYPNAIKSVSLFEQPLDGQRGLEAKHFREYAVYRNTEQAAGTILAWRDHELSYVLISNADMSQLMDMAQSISAER